MNEHLVSDRPVAISLLGLFVLFFLGFVVIGPALGIAAASLIYDGDVLQAMTNPLAHPDVRNAILLSQGIASFFGLVVMPWFYLRTIEKKSWRPFFKKEPHGIQIFLVLAIAIMVLSICISPVAEWNAALEFPSFMAGFGKWAKETEDLAAGIIKMITDNLSPGQFAVSMLVIALIPAIGEEVVFRGLIQNEMYRANRNPHTAIWLTAIIFSAVHLQFLGFVPRVLLGAFLGYIYYWSGNLLIPMLAHFLNNGLQLLGMYLYQNGVLTFDVEETTSAPWPWVLFSLLVLGVVLYYLRNYFTSRTATLS